MFGVVVNLWAVLVSGAASLAVGFVWFLVLFRDAYTEGLGKTAEELAKGPSLMTAASLQLIGNIAMAYFLAWLMACTGMQSVSQGLMLAVMVWLGFIVAFLGPTYAFQAYSLKFFLIVAGSALITLLITGAIVGAWK